MLNSSRATRADGCAHVKACAGRGHLHCAAPNGAPPEAARGAGDVMVGFRPSRRAGFLAQNGGPPPPAPTDASKVDADEPRRKIEGTFAVHVQRGARPFRYRVLGLITCRPSSLR